jgi:hypothetical protein
MAWDLGKAMRKKEEFESARLLDFEFRQRARATRLLARAFGLDQLALVREVVARDDAGLLDLVAAQTGQPRDEVSAEYGRCLAVARQELVRERGDPTPYRLG